MGSGFLLSVDETYMYFGADEDRRATYWPQTAFQSEQDLAFHISGSGGIKGGETGWWWLRSPGGHGHGASCVYYGGGLYDIGFSVNYSGGSVRPALWLNL